MRATLKRLHERHGGLLFREAGSANAKLWVDSAALTRLWPDRFGASPPTAATVAGLMRRVETAEDKAERALAEASILRKEIDDWRRTGRRG